MSVKVFLGIIVPAVLIIVLTIVASIDAGFSVQRTYVEKLAIEDVFADGTLKSTIEIGKIKLVNDYFLPKRYEVDYTTVCLVDDDGEREPQDAGYLSYSEGDVSAGYYDSYSYSNGRGTSLEIGADDVKTVKIYLNPQNLYAYEYDSNKTQQEIILDKYGDYDAVVLVETKNEGYYYNSCYSFSEAQLESSRRISLK